MLGEREQLVVELDGPRRHVMANDQGARIVHQNVLRHPAERHKGALKPREPTRLLLMPKRANMQASRVSQRCDEDEDLHADAADRHQTLTEVDLKLAPRRRLEADAGQCLGLERLTEGTNCALQRPQAYREPFLGQQVLPQNVGVSTMPKEPLTQPILMAIQSLRTDRRLEGLKAFGCQIGPHRMMTAA